MSTTQHKFDPRVGIGLRAPHIDTLLADSSPIEWVEVHSENWLADAGPIVERLAEIRARFDLSLHGVGLSLGSADGIDRGHLRRLKRLVDRCRPVLVSEHLSWGARGGSHSNDLLPVPFTAHAARMVAAHVDQVQQHLGRSILVENISSYCQFEQSVLPEWVFVREVVERADCRLLLDLNNVYVNACNHGFDIDRYLDAMPWGRIDEAHLAGFERWDDVLVDTHSRPVQAPVWDLLRRVRPRLSDATRVLIEWDTDLPPLPTLLAEAEQASRLLQAESVDA